MSKLLLDESPILVLPSLAKKIGLNESIFLQQLHYWLKESKNVNDGHAWVYNTYEDWQEQFPFWSVSTIRRIITKLENADLLIIANYNKLKIDQTKWYRINYFELEGMNRPFAQNEQTECSEWTAQEVNLNRPLPENTTEITTKNKEEVEEPHTSENPFRFFEENGFGMLGGYISEKIGQWCEELSDELVLEALKVAVESGVKQWRYVERILTNWLDKKIKTVDDARALMLAFKENQSKQRVNHRKGKQTRTEMLPDWFNEDYEPSQQDKPKSSETDDKRELEELIKKMRGEE